MNWSHDINENDSLSHMAFIVNKLYHFYSNLIDFLMVGFSFSLFILLISSDR